MQWDQRKKWKQYRSYPAGYRYYRYYILAWDHLIDLGSKNTFPENFRILPHCALSLRISLNWNWRSRGRSCQKSSYSSSSERVELIPLEIWLAEKSFGSVTEGKIQSVMSCNWFSIDGVTKHRKWMILAFLRGSYAFLWHKVERGLLVPETVFEITSKKSHSETMRKWDKFGDFQTLCWKSKVSSLEKIRTLKK